MSFYPQLQAVSFIADETKAYWVYLKQSLEEWGRRRNVRSSYFHSRLRGENNMCQTGSWPAPEALLYRSEVERYTAVNFDALRKHGTIEVRVLPMFRSAKIAVAAVGTVLSATDEYLTHCFDEPAFQAVAEATFDTTPVSVVLPPSDPFERASAGEV